MIKYNICYNDVWYLNLEFPNNVDRFIAAGDNNPKKRL